MYFKQNNIYFSTISINRRVSVFHDFDKTNQFVLDSFNYFYENNYADIYAFVIMRDHIHLIWNILDKYNLEEITTSFKKYTGRKITDYLKFNDDEYLDYFASGRSDRKYKIWKIKSRHTKILHKSIYKQKLNYIHKNPTKGDFKTVDVPEDYYYSSALSYKTSKKNFSFLTLLIV